MLIQLKSIKQEATEWLIYADLVLHMLVAIKKAKKPLGRLADAELRKFKMKAHSFFDQVWQRGYKKRSNAYSWLAEKMSIDKKDCHIGMFDVEKCKRVIEITSEFLCRKGLFRQKTVFSRKAL